MQQREGRQAVIVPAQFRHRGGWVDATIRNISPHGMMLLGARPPRPGSFIEIRRGALLLVARIVWRKGVAFGVHLLDRLDFGALLRAANEGHAAGQTRRPVAPAAGHMLLGRARLRLDRWWGPTAS